jgi:hypothetical protein
MSVGAQIAVSISTGYRLDCQDLITGRGQKILLFSTASKPALGPTLPLIQWLLGVLSVFHTSLLMTWPFWTPIFLHIGLDTVDHKHGHFTYIPQISFYGAMTKSQRYILKNNFGRGFRIILQGFQHASSDRESPPVTVLIDRSMKQSARWSLWASARTINNYHYFCKLINKYVWSLIIQKPFVDLL